ncbi:LytS/YhcK type 5TM receptor domain-containing protein [Domibacillus mangrovi]|nr:LytS/YhcK type 5TM receptor domain-containing protein [Domibacillus mangrovi]
MIAFVLTRLSFFREIIYRDHLENDQRIKAIFFFSFFGIIGTYSGIAFNSDSGQFNVWAFDLANEEAIANSRVIGIVMAGLFGGWKVGLGTGLIAGIHRYTLGGFTDIACGSASVLAGLIAGRFHQKKNGITLSTAFFAGALSECLQMGMILLIAKPFDRALILVEQIGIPMILANGLGAALFLLIIKSVINEEEKAAALQAQKTLRLASETIKHLRNGLDAESAQLICEIVHKEVPTSAVSIMNHERILAFVGTGKPAPPLNVGNSAYTITKSGYDTVIAAPIQQGAKNAGLLLFYFRSEKEATELAIESLLGISSLLGNQLKMAEIEKTFSLAKEAEIKALQAQISPHFLFNSLNTIVSLTRIEPDKARRLLLSLSHFLRKNLSATTAEWTTLLEELQHVKAYLSIEETRFEDKLSVRYHIDDTILHAMVPPLTLQPIVENAVKYSLSETNSHSEVTVSIKQCKDSVIICVCDNGPGIEVEQLAIIGQQPVSSDNGSGIGLYNVNRRLIMLFGETSKLIFTKRESGGTSVSFSVPMKGMVNDESSNTSTRR